MRNIAPLIAIANKELCLNRGLAFSEERDYEEILR